MAVLLTGAAFPYEALQCLYVPSMGVQVYLFPHATLFIYVLAWLGSWLMLLLLLNSLLPQCGPAKQI